MADSGITLCTEGTDKLAVTLGGIAHDVKNLGPAMRDSGEYLTKFYSGQVFASRGGVIGKPWPRLTPSYAALKAEHFPGRPPLIRTGLMNKSFKYQYAALHARVFNTAPYFEEHQEGTRKMPARVMMALDEQRVRQVAQIIGNYIYKQVGSA